MKFDTACLDPETGIRALWLLYRRGKWGLLEDFDIQRSVVQPLLEQFEDHEFVRRRLTIDQCYELEETIPGFREAGRELRLQYALLHFGDTHEVLSRPRPHHPRQFERRGGRKVGKRSRR